MFSIGWRRRMASGVGFCNGIQTGRRGALEFTEISSGDLILVIGGGFG